MQYIEGTYYLPASSQSVKASITVNGDLVTVSDDQNTSFTTNRSLISVASAIPGVKLEIKFRDGGLFVAANATDRLAIGNKYIERLEENKKLIVASLVLVPFCIWFILVVLIPAVARNTVQYLPDTISEQMGEQAFNVLEKTLLTPSELNEDIKLDIEKQWRATISALSLSEQKYRLYFFKSEHFGANAFALPNGIIVITDELVTLLEEDVEVIQAILLHEIGHVEHKHSLKLVTQSVSNAVVLSVAFGDLDGIGELMVGTGAALTQNAFSRDMEREADSFALQKLVELNKSPQVFAKAMQSFLKLKAAAKQGDRELDGESILRYLSTHPDTEERIKTAQDYGR